MYESLITAWGYIKSYYITILFVLLIALLVFWKKLFSRFRKREEPDTLNYAKDFSDKLFPDQNFSILVGMYDQKKSAENQIESITKESKKMVADFKSLNSYYTNQRKHLTLKKKQLEIKYNTYMNQLEMIERMIADQEKIEGGK